ncbi:MerR family transcriptional regulator [Catelliglobosispora koreensis]|uniref:MerR family transcriptional regulator n=1 Tax=Catelliglobosispora koreensis TaxID=129052 RepID=UPI000366A0D1|nr:MerR family transcriptional regulator [Catelliglobosispora koreensis]
MRIAELSRASGVPVPTIKYYLREGLLPPGEFSSPNQARYDEGHVRRLKLVRALVEVGRVPIGGIKELLAELDQPEPNVHRAIGCALEPGLRREPEEDNPEIAAAKADLDQLIERRGWNVDDCSPAYQQIAEVMVTLRRLGTADLLDGLEGYAQVADKIAEIDLGLVARHRNDPGHVVFEAVIGTIIGDSLLQGLRRLAQENLSAKVFQANAVSS